MKQYKKIFFSILMSIVLCFAFMPATTFAKELDSSLATPSNVVVKNQSVDSNQLTWNGIGNVDGYTIFRGTSEDGQYEEIGSVPISEYYDKTAKTGVTYWYKLRAYKGDSYGQFSVPVSVKTSGVNKPTGLTLSSTKNTITAKWSGNGAGYQLAYKRSGGKYQYYTTSSTRKTVKKLTSSKSYYFKVRAYVKVDGKKIYSSWTAVEKIKLNKNASSNNSSSGKICSTCGGVGAYNHSYMEPHFVNGRWEYTTNYRWGSCEVCGGDGKL